MDTLTNYGSGNSALVAQFTDMGKEIVLTGGSYIYTFIHILLAFVQANAIYIIIISLFLGLLSYIAYKRRMKKVSANLS